MGPLWTFATARERPSTSESVRARPKALWTTLIRAAGAAMGTGSRSEGCSKPPAALSFPEKLDPNWTPANFCDGLLQFQIAGYL